MTTVFFVIIGVFFILIFVALDQNLRILKKKEYHDAIQDNPFMRVLDRIFNDFFEWKRWKKILWVVLLITIGLFCSTYLFIRYTMPITPKVKKLVINHNDSLVLTRGRYLAEHVAICTDCHSPRNSRFYSWPVIEAQKGAGGPFLSRSAGFNFPGESFTPNISPTGIGNWTDGELYRAITSGIRPDGSTLYHAMPFESFGKADPADIKAIIAYVRKLRPVSNTVYTKSRIDFLPRLYNRTISRKTKPTYLEDLKNAVDSGRYLVAMAGCNDCHTPKKWADFPDSSRLLSGGLEFPMPTGGYVYSANLTPDESGLMYWSEETFVNKFKSYLNPNGIYRVSNYKLNTIMPWSAYRYMTARDLKSIYAYLRTLKPVFNPVTKFTLTSIKKKKEETE